MPTGVDCVLQQWGDYASEPCYHKESVLKN